MHAPSVRSTASRDPARQIFISERKELGTQLGESGLQRRAPVLVLVGGADGMDAETIARLEPLFTRAIAPLAEALGAYVVDGGTDAGVMGMMGRAREALSAQFPLIGVVPRGLLQAPPALGRRASLEPHHSHRVLVPGAIWEDAGPWLDWIAEELAGGMPSVTLLINGGELSWEDVQRSVRQGRPVIAVDGSGRAADALAAALTGEGRASRAAEVLTSGLVEAVSATDGPSVLARLLGARLTSAAPVTEDEQGTRDYTDLERRDLDKLIDRLELSDLQKHSLRSRWLDQVMWMDGKARQAQRLYYVLRLIVILGSITIPLLVGLGHKELRPLTVVTGMLVALSAAVEEFFRFGERWRHYRRTVERLKAEGWRFVEGTGPYQRFRNHRAAYSEFAGAVEQLLEEDVRTYMEEIAREQKPKENKQTPAAVMSAPVASPGIYSQKR